jgi:type II secretory pathway component PulL
MKKTNKLILVLRAPASDQGEFRWLLTDNSGDIDEGILTSLDSIVSRKFFDNIVLLVPASVCFIWQEEIIKKRFRLPAHSYLWKHEERLLLDAEKMHAGYISIQDNKAWMCGIEIIKLKKWIKELTRFDIIPDSVYPDVALLPVGESICFDGELILRNSDNDYRVVPIESLDEWPEATIKKKLIAHQHLRKTSSMHSFRSSVPPGPGLLTGLFRPRMKASRLRGKRFFLGVIIFWLLTVIFLPQIKYWLAIQQNNKAQDKFYHLASQAFDNLPKDKSWIIWLKSNLNHHPKSSMTLTNFIKENNDFFSEIEQGSVQGFNWDANSHHLQLTIINYSASLEVIAKEYSNNKREITLHHIKGSRLVELSIRNNIE